MAYKLGQFVVENTIVPASSDNNVMFRVFTGHPRMTTLVTAFGYYGGDANEYGSIVLAPPNATVDGSADAAIDQNTGTIAITSANALRGQVAQINYPNALGSQTTTAGNYAGDIINYPIHVPPGWILCFRQSTANSNLWGFTVGGFRLGE
jgi:hypothetical protein|tara:strand:- start:1054 stop:1503 length:450 start_codon:yes stop_codon:yes gene_type:complete